MESIAITKPNMAVLSAEGGMKSALSPFGLLSALFTAELARRASQRIGEYRPLSLAFAEEQAAENSEPLPAPEVHLDLDVNLVLKLLREERKKEKDEKKTPTVGERIIERVLLRERELRAAGTETRRVIIQNGGRRQEMTLPLAGKKTSDAEPEKKTALQPAFRGEGKRTS